MARFSLITNSFWGGVTRVFNTLEILLKKEYPDSTVFKEFLSTNTFSFSILRDIRSNPPDVLFIGGWDNTLKTLVHNIDRNKTKVILVWCSPLTQVDLGGELGRFLDVWNLSQSGMISNVCLGVESNYQALNPTNKSISFTPFYFEENELDPYRQIVEKSSEFDSSKIHCDFFCAPCPRKNIFAQICSLSQFKENINPHFNYTDAGEGMRYIEAASSLLSNITNHGFLETQNYFSLIRQMDFGMQVTLSESFNYVAAEHMYMSIPVVLSKATPFVRYHNDDISGLIVDSPEDTRQISEIAGKIILDPVFRKEMGEVCFQYIKKYNDSSKSIFTENIKQMISKGQ